MPTLTGVNRVRDVLTATYEMFDTITFDALPGKVYGDAEFALGATASSGLTVSYASSNEAVAKIVNGSKGATLDEVAERDDIKGIIFTSGKASGTGLGTYSALLMARVQDGDIGVDTSEAGGTTLTAGTLGVTSTLAVCSRLSSWFLPHSSPIAPARQAMTSAMFTPSTTFCAVV